MIENEEKILKQLNHPNIIKSLGSDEDDFKKVLILECFSCDLENFILI